MSDEEQVQLSPTQVAAETAFSARSPMSDELDAEAAEAIRRIFEEMSFSSSRIVKSLEQLNALAQEIYCELDATTKALSLRG